MARRYRYAFAKKREASKGKWSVGLAAASLVLFIAAVVLALFFDGKLGGLIGGTGLFAMLLSAYGFTLGAFQLFGRKPETQDEHGRVYFERSDPGYLAGTFLSGYNRWIKRTLKTAGLIIRDR